MRTTKKKGQRFITAGLWMARRRGAWDGRIAVDPWRDQPQEWVEGSGLLVLRTRSLDEAFRMLLMLSSYPEER